MRRERKKRREEGEICGKRGGGGGEGYEEEVRLGKEVEEGKAEQPFSDWLTHHLRHSQASKESLMAPYPSH